MRTKAERIAHCYESMKLSASLYRYWTTENPYTEEAERRLESLKRQAARMVRLKSEA